MSYMLYIIYICIYIYIIYVMYYIYVYNTQERMQVAVGMVGRACARGEATGEAILPPTAVERLSSNIYI